MFKTISDIKQKPFHFIKDFLHKCVVEEKIDTYYVSVLIVNKKELVFYKSNGNQISRADLILNEMWQNMINDWLHFRMINEEWFNSHVGHKINMFYFPVDKPILTEYKKDVRYVISSIDYIGERILDCYSYMESMDMLDKFGIKFKQYFTLNDFTDDDLHNALSGTDDELEKFFESLINKDDSEIYAKKEPEGFIFKSGKKNKYQIIKKPLDERYRLASQQQTQYEYTLLDFIKFYTETDDVYNLFDRSYIKTVCNLFNDYINRYEKVNENIINNVDADSLQNPYVGHRFDICYNNIPNPVTVEICKSNELYKNVFKILLVNLKHEKRIDREYMLMNSRNINIWNDIVQCVKNVAVSE